LAAELCPDKKGEGRKEQEKGEGEENGRRENGKFNSTIEDNNNKILK